MLAILLFPTYLMVIPIALMFVRKLSNNWIYGIHLLLLWGSAIIFGILICDADGQDGADSIFAGIMMGLFMLLCNTIQFNLVTRLLELHRCPDCHRMCLEKISKEVHKHVTTTVRVYKYESKPGFLRKKFHSIIKKTYYELYCPECDNTYEVTMVDKR